MESVQIEVNHYENTKEYSITVSTFKNNDLREKSFKSFSEAVGFLEKEATYLIDKSYNMCSEYNDELFTFGEA